MSNYKTIKIKPDTHEALVDKKYKLSKKMDNPSFNDTITHLLEQSGDKE